MAASLAQTADFARSYSHAVRKRAALLGLLGLACIAAFLADLVIGGGTLSLPQVLQGLFAPGHADPSTRVILWQLRLPVACTAAIAGAGLAVAGSLMQLALVNPLAEPFTLGLSSAAGFGAALAIILGPMLAAAFGGLPLDLVISASAFVFSLIVVAGIGVIGHRRQMRPETIALIGIAIHFTFSALLAFTQYAADSDQLQSLVFWLLDSVQRTSWLKVGIDAGLFALLMPLLLGRAWMLTAAAGLGDQAAAYGIRLARLRFLLLGAAALLAGAVTATIGIVGFVGLVAPHIARLLVGEDQRFALAISAACGCLIMLVAAIASQVIIPGAILPIGMLTALLGVPFFLWQILRREGGHA